MKVHIGTELKLNINIPPMGDVTASTYDFEVEFYTSTRRIVKMSKADMIATDDDNYIACLDSEKLGSGNLRCRLTAHIPDEDFPDGLRTEVVGILTDITIVQYM